MLTHCRSLTTACLYREGKGEKYVSLDCNFDLFVILLRFSPLLITLLITRVPPLLITLLITRVLPSTNYHCTGETMICTEDPKRSIGLWHGVMAAAYNGLHVVYVPPNVMTTLPTAWLHMIQKHKGWSCVTVGNEIIIQ